VDARYDASLPTPRYFLDLISCRSGCPVRTNAGAYVRAVAEGDYEKGYRVAQAPNPWVSVCAHVCAHPCEKRCRRGTIDQPISIRALKRTLTERYGTGSVAASIEEPAPLGVAARVGDEPARVAVVGAGPAGLACAHDLAFLGYRVTVFEATPVVGGMLAQGIPEYRLPRDIMRAEIERTVRMGVEVKTNWRLGRDFTVADLKRNGYAAVFLAFGATRGRDLQVPGAELDGVINGVDFLLNANLGYQVSLGSHVIVVGGGSVAIDVARTVLRYGAREEQGLMPPGAEALLESWGYDNTLIDAARTALRLGARRVTIVSLERRHEMPATPEEVAQAEEEGIRFIGGRGPKQFFGRDGKVTAIETVDVASIFDEQGRFNPTFVPGSESRIDGDTIVLAIGQKPDVSALAGDPDITITPRGLVQVDPRTLATAASGVYCGGDLAFGPRIIIDAAGDGKRAALAIHQHLGGAALDRAPMRFRRLSLSRWAEDYDRIPRHDVPCLPVQRRVGFREVEMDYAEADAQAEGRRCLWCNVSPIFDSEKCILCAGCVDICPENCLKLVRADRLTGVAQLEALRERLGASPDAGVILKDEDRCIRCGLCADRCPTGAVTMELLEVENGPAASLQLFAEEMGGA
jgi:NADPH-dependent glutamate synthase beta subunit-like oxidoreductase/formate hydrogenlyase subunit 6/NADH:ubiquinone oxidoreductase subunit I